MLKHANEPRAELEGSALTVRGPSFEGDRQGKPRPWCDHCRRPWHTRETCWKLHGKPGTARKKHGNNKPGGETLALQVNTSESMQQSQESSPFTKEQLEHLQKLFQSQSIGNSSTSCSLAQSGMVFVGTIACTKSSGFWILDSGATDHMTGTSQLFSSYKPVAGNFKVKIADGSYANVAGKGPIPLSSNLTLKDVLHVPTLSYNLLSISKFTKDHNCTAHFYSSGCVFQDLTSGEMIGDAKQDDGLYLLNTKPNGMQDQQTCFNSVVVSGNAEILLWHHRLGHPSFSYLKLLFPKLFLNKQNSDFQCESCELAKHHRTSFFPQTHKKSAPFTMIHSDVWGAL